MGPEAWIKLLYTYGPFALLVFFMFVAERKSYNAWKNAPPKMQSVLYVYLGNWIAIFALLSFSVYAWMKTNLTEEFTIRGVFENLENSETLTSRSSALYLNRKYGPGGKFDYEWRLVTSKQLGDDEKVRFTFDRSTCGSENFKDYELSIKSSYYSDGVNIVFDRPNDRLLVRHKNQVHELRPVLSLTTAPVRESTSFFTSNAYAGEVQSTSQIAGRLESNDSIIRREARTDLAKQGKTALPWIEKVLDNPNSSYRQTVGVIAALTQMRELRLEDFKSATIKQIIRSSGDRDRTLRVVARGFIVKYMSWDLEKMLQEEIDSMRRSHTVESRRMTAELNRTKLDLLYNLGVSEKDKYGSRRPEDRQRIEKAIGAFKGAWESRSLVPDEDRFVFVKALYGWGLALHDRSWIDVSADQRRKPELVQLAVDKFKEFLNPGRSLGKWKKDEYTEYLIHRERAEKYVQNPIPASLM